MPIFLLTGLNTLIFVGWTFMMFKTLFALRRRAVARTGKTVPGLGDTLTEWAHWWRSPELARDRRILIALTMALLASVFLMAMLAPTP